MTKLCPRGKAAAKRKFSVYPSAYANAYASKICAGKIKDPSGVKRKDFKGPKPSKAMGGRIYKSEGGPLRQFGRKKPQYITRKEKPQYITRKEKPQYITKKKTPYITKKEKPQYITKKKTPYITKKTPYITKKEKPSSPYITRKEKPKRLMREPESPSALARPKMMGGGMMKMPRAMYKKGGIAKGCGAVMSDRRKVTKVF